MIEKNPQPSMYNVWKNSARFYTEKNNVFCHNFSQICLSLKLIHFIEIFSFA